MENRLGFTKQMKEMMGMWKGKNLKGYIENSDDGYITRVRFLIEDKAFDFDNEYTAYRHSDEDEEELSCFSCIEIEDNSCLETAVVDGKSKENIVGERIQGVYIVRDVKKEASIDNKDVYEFAFETALVIQIENRCYAFWRHLIFDRIFIKDCKNMEEVLRTIKSVEEIQEEAQVENPYIVTVERSIEEL